MSKYRIIIRPSRLKWVFYVAGAILLLCSLLGWKADVIPFQTYIQLAAGMTIIICSLGYAKHLVKQQALRVVSISDEGKFLPLVPIDRTELQMTSRCRVTPFAVFVALSEQPVAMGSINKPQGAVQQMWLFRDQVSDKSFRRLCRIALRVQQAQQ